jgi:hypothetical protein
MTNFSSAELSYKASNQKRNALGEFEGTKHLEAGALVDRAVRAPAPNYVAPDRAALQTLVNANGKIQTWGSFLEEINPEGTHLGLASHRSSRTAVLVRARDGETSFVIPAAVAKASGLASVDTEKDLASLRMETTENALDNYEARLSMGDLVSRSTDMKRQDLSLARDQARWDFDRVLNEEAAELYARDGQYIVADALAHFDETGRLPISNSRVLTFAALDDEDLALKLMSLSERHDMNPFRDGMNRQLRSAFVDHESESVRAAAIEKGYLPNSLGVMSGYIGRHPSQRMVQAANTFFASSGQKGKFTLDDGVIRYVDVEGRTNSSVKVANAARRYEAQLQSPVERNTAKKIF